MTDPKATAMARQIMYQRALESMEDQAAIKQLDGKHIAGFEELQVLAAEMLVARSDYLEACAAASICSKFDCVARSVRGLCLRHTGL